MEKFVATIIVLVITCAVAQFGSIWVGNTFIYTQYMRDSLKATAAANVELLKIENATQKEILEYATH
jgi:hypothetical protein